jgi:hypothetical protein
LEIHLGVLGDALQELLFAGLPFESRQFREVVLYSIEEVTAVGALFRYAVGNEKPFGRIGQPVRIGVIADDPQR